MCTEVCKEPTRCYCRPSYLRNAAGVCVPSTECKAAATCPEHEVVPPCVPCRQTCEHKNRRFCAHVCIKTDKCFCDNGYLRAANGTCIKEDDCEKFGGFAIAGRRPTVLDIVRRVARNVNSDDGCNGDNEHKPYCIPCHKTCDDVNRMCIEVCRVNEGQCYCKPGFVRNANGNCIKEAHC